jgi:hypothetical protein
MIWTSNDTVVESVELTDDTYEVELNYLDDFVSYGWSNFAAFGMASTGGWAKKDGLYCICRHYDLDSERFKLSFLKHEARHYADFKLYPELQPADLEYRGKLTELAYSEEGIYRLLEQFTKAANRVENAPHPLANWYVQAPGNPSPKSKFDRPQGACFKFMTTNLPTWARPLLRVSSIFKGASFVQDLPRRQLARCMRKRAADSPNTISLNDVLPLD